MQPYNEAPVPESPIQVELDHLLRSLPDHPTLVQILETQERVEDLHDRLTDEADAAEDAMDELEELAAARSAEARAEAESEMERSYDESLRAHAAAEQGKAERLSTLEARIAALEKQLAEALQK